MKILTTVKFGSDNAGCVKYGSGSNYYYCY